MSAAIHLIPVAIAAAITVALWRVCGPRGWLRGGEIAFWGAISLVVVFLVWLRWF